MPRDDLERLLQDAEMAAYQRNLGFYQHPELVEVSHILAQRNAGDPPARVALLRGRAEEVARRARRARSESEFQAIARELSSAEVPLKAEAWVTDEHSRSVKEFADAAFALRAPGDASAVVET